MCIRDRCTAVSKQERGYPLRINDAVFSWIVWSPSSTPVSYTHLIAVLRRLIKHFSKQRYLPEELGEQKFYKPSENGYERQIKKYLDWIHEE